MSVSLPSQSFRPARPLDVPAALRELAAALPIVIFAKAIRDAFFKKR